MVDAERRAREEQARLAAAAAAPNPDAFQDPQENINPVSYTHLTLPTIYSV